MLERKNYNLAICAVFRNEAPYLEEWIDFHLKQGVEHFFLINDKSNDDFIQVLQPFIKNRIVTLTSSKKWDQLFEYNRALKKYGKRTKWMAFIDIDEFLFAPNGGTIPAALVGLQEFSSVWVGWKIYGSSGLVEEPDGVVNNFLECARWPSSEVEKQETASFFLNLRGNTSLTGHPFNGKSIIQSSRVSEMGIHSPKQETGEGFRDDSFQHLRINHYWSRSLSYLQMKSKRPGIAKDNREQKTRPGKSAVTWETGLNKSLDPIASRITNPKELPFVVFLGFNKTATRSLHQLMTDNGFPGVHWDKNKLVETMLGNRSRGNRLLIGYEEYRCFSDLTYASENFFFEGNSLFKELERDYPDAFFILNNRDTDKWIRSRMLHNNGLFAQRHKNIRNLDSYEQLAQVWREEKKQHVELVREFFEGDNHFLEFDIEDKGIGNKIGKLLKMDLEQPNLKTVGKTKTESLT